MSAVCCFLTEFGTNTPVFQNYFDYRCGGDYGGRKSEKRKKGKNTETTHAGTEPGSKGEKF